MTDLRPEGKAAAHSWASAARATTPLNAVVTALRATTVITSPEPAFK